MVYWRRSILATVTISREELDGFHLELLGLESRAGSRFRSTIGSSLSDLREPHAAGMDLHAVTGGYVTFTGQYAVGRNSGLPVNSKTSMLCGSRCKRYRARLSTYSPLSHHQLLSGMWLSLWGMIIECLPRLVTLARGSEVNRYWFPRKGELGWLHRPHRRKRIDESGC